jgi:uncharacterized membrane protein
MSELWKLGKSDWIKGLIVAVLTAVLTLVVQILKERGIDLTSSDWQQILTVTLTATASYLLKNLTTDGSGKVLGKF